jgi:aquaporin Z
LGYSTRPGGKNVTSNSRILGAETLGTAVLMLGGPGSAILAGSSISPLGVAFAFGLSLMVMTYAIGPISGAHLNPAVTLAMVLTRKTSEAAAPFYVIGQILGAVIGGGIIYSIASGTEIWERNGNAFASNAWGAGTSSGYGLGSTIVVEIVFTALLVFVVLMASKRNFARSATGLAVGFTYMLIHLVTMPIDNTSVNPARSVGTAIFSDWDLDPIKQLWAFIVFPLLGAVVGVFAWLFVDDATLEDTMLDSEPLRTIRDAGDRVADQAVDAITDITD